jgi:hypothetical protein
MPAEGSALSLPEILSSASLALALMAYTVLSGTQAVASARLHDLVGEGAGAWWWDHLYAPMLRAAILLAFLLIAYPTIYGLSEAPPLLSVLFAGEGRFGQLLGVLFLLSLVLPLVPVAGALPGLMLPIQGVAGTALLFSWLGQALGVTQLSYWPGARDGALMVAVSFAAYWLAKGCVAALQGIATRWNVADLDELAFEAVLLLFQAPAIVLYSASLGRQLIG